MGLRLSQTAGSTPSFAFTRVALFGGISISALYIGVLCKVVFEKRFLMIIKMFEVFGSSDL